MLPTLRAEIDLFAVILSKAKDLKEKILHCVQNDRGGEGLFVAALFRMTGGCFGSFVLEEAVPFCAWFDSAGRRVCRRVPG